MDSEYAEVYADLHRHHWWWRSREEYLFSILQGLSIPKNSNILEIGCGGGWLFDRLGQWGQVDGVEIDGSLIPQEGAHAENIYHGPFDREFQPGKQYSLILMLDVLEHIEDANAALAYAVELLEPTGVMLLTVPAFRSLWTAHDVLNHHFTRYNKRSFGAVAEAAGMRVDRCNYFFHWLTLIKLGIRCKEALIATEPSLPKMPSRPVNSLFYGITRLEQSLFYRLPLPVGSSLLAIGGRAGS